MFGIHGWEWVIIAFVVMLVFGGSDKLPELAKSLGKAINEFKKSIKEVQSTVMGDDDHGKPDGDKPTKEIQSTVTSDDHSKHDGDKPTN